ncbi:MAG TPA: hypothetical protein VGM32_23020 [Rhodopila sp.]
MAFFSSHATPIWSLLPTLLGALDPWVPHRPHRDYHQDQPELIDTNTEICVAETGQRTAFLEMLMAEIAGMRQVIRDYERDTDSLRQRLNTALAQCIVLRAIVEIMEKRVAFLQERLSLPDGEDAGVGTPRSRGAAR